MTAGRTLICEHKTTSEDVGPGSMYWTRLTLDPQVSVYLDAARASGIDAEGVLYDVLRKPAHRQAKGDKTPEDLERRCVAAIVEEPDKYLQRGVIVRLEDEAKEAAQDLWQTADLIRLSRASGRWPRNPDACVTYGRPCEYWPVCSGQADIGGLQYSPAEDRYAHVRRSLPVLSQSDVRKYRACPRRYYFARELGRVPAIVAEPLWFGTAIHKALEVWWSSRGDVEQALSTLAQLEPWSGAKARAMVRCYHVRWESDLPRWEAVQVEREFVVPLVNPDTGAKSRTWEIGGRVDAIATEVTT